MRSTDREVVNLLRAFGASPNRVFRLAELPSAMPSIFAGARIAVAICVIGAVFGELVGAKAGLGYLLTRSIAQFETPRMVAAIFLLAVMGSTLFALGVAERLLLPGGVMLPLKRDCTRLRYYCFCPVSTPVPTAPNPQQYV